MKTQTFYDTVATDYDSRFQNTVALIENALICANLPTRNVLDLGCGTSLYLEYVTPDGYVGIDLSKAMRDRQGVGRCATRAAKGHTASRRELCVVQATADF